TLLPLQTGDINIQVHPINALDFQGDVLTQHFGNPWWYAHFGSGTTPVLGDRLPLGWPISLARAACGSPLSTAAISRISVMPWLTEIHLVGLERSLASAFSSRKLST